MKLSTSPTEAQAARGFGSPSSAISTRKVKLPKGKSFLRQRIEVGTKPQSSAQGETTSEMLGKLLPGTMLIFKMRCHDDGDVRARVALIDEKEGDEKVAEGWWRPFNVTAAFTDIFESYLGPEHLMLHGPSSTEADSGRKDENWVSKSQLKSVRFNRASDPQKPKRSNRKRCSRNRQKHCPHRNR